MSKSVVYELNSRVQTWRTLPKGVKGYSATSMKTSIRLSHQFVSARSMRNGNEGEIDSVWTGQAGRICDQWPQTGGCARRRKGAAHLEAQARKLPVRADGDSAEVLRDGNDDGDIGRKR